jgi:hypothetical protein
MAEASQGNFPDNITLQFATFSASRSEATDIESAYSGREVRRARFPLGGYRTITAVTAPLTQADAQTLRDFLRARRGRAQAFQIYQPDVEKYVAEPAGSVVASATFQIPFTTANGGAWTTIYVGGVSKAFTIGTRGSYSQDIITFSGGAQTGAVTLDGTARPMLLVRSDYDNYEHALMMTTGYHSVWNLKFKEVV